MSLEDERTLGEHAERLLNDEVLNNAFAELEARFHEQWANSNPEDSEGRDKLYWALRGLKFAQQQLRITLDNGKIAAEKLSKE